MSLNYNFSTFLLKGTIDHLPILCLVFDLKKKLWYFSMKNFKHFCDKTFKMVNFCLNLFLKWLHFFTQIKHQTQNRQMANSSL